MLNKSLAIIIDDFSDRIFQYDNVTFYDFGTFTVSSTYDFFYNTDGSFDGYGVGFVDNDYIETLSVNSNDFFRITPSNNSSYDFISDDDVDFINLSDQQQTLSHYMDQMYFKELRQLPWPKILQVTLYMIILVSLIYILFLTILLARYLILLMLIMETGY